MKTACSLAVSSLVTLSWWGGLAQAASLELTKSEVNFNLGKILLEPTLIIARSEIDLRRNRFKARATIPGFTPESQRLQLQLVVAIRNLITGEQAFAVEPPLTLKN